jgi:hypothetical protein
MVPSVSESYLKGPGFAAKFALAVESSTKLKPVFIRNLAVRR